MTLSFEECKKLGADMPNFEPFAKDIDGALLCVKKDTGTLIVWEDGEIGEDLKQSFARYLEEIRDHLLMKKLVYEEGLGLVGVA